MLNFGPLKSISIEKIDYRFSPDAAVEFTFAKWKSTPQRTSLGTIMIMEPLTPGATGIDIIATEEEVLELRDYSNNSQEVVVTVETLRGGQITSAGSISFESWNSQTGKASLTFACNDEWDILTP